MPYAALLDTCLVGQIPIPDFAAIAILKGLLVVCSAFLGAIASELIREWYNPPSSGTR